MRRVTRRWLEPGGARAALDTGNLEPMKSITLVAVVFAALAAGCGSSPAPSASAPGAAPPAAHTSPPPGAAVASPRLDTRSPTSGSVRIEDRILKACGDIPTAHFAFDSSSIEGSAARSLEALARCFTTGPLAGKGMKLVGHADARGETEYNFALGQKRAGSVGEFLTKKGLDKSRVDASSRGDLEATGVDEEGWARDRRVDVFLAD
jgi:peptidoglycan-associated lipoprotein